MYSMKKFFALWFTLYLLVFQNAISYSVEALPPQAPSPPPETGSASVVLMDADTGITLYGKDPHERVYPASVTKVMTALLTLEQCENLTEPVSFSRFAVFSLPRNASHIAMDEGETLTVYDALCGLLLSSANEVANALAEHVAGSVDDFALLMNKRAQALGAVNTHFSNPTGLHDPEHYTTAHDMAIIMKEAVKHPVFNEIIAKRRHDIPPTERQTLHRELLNTHRSIHPGQHFNETAIGGKTGFTNEAQNTLITYAMHDGRSLIASVMNGQRPGTYDDTNALLAYGFLLPYEEQIIFDGNAYERVVPVYHEAEQIGEVTLTGADDLLYLLPQGFNRADIRYEVDWPRQLSPPILIGDTLGTVACFIQDKKVGEVALTAANPVFVPVPPTTDPDPMATMPVMATETTPLNLPRPEPEEAYRESEATTSRLFEPLWETDYLLTFAVPLALSAAALLVSVLLFIFKRKRRQAQILKFDRYVRYGNLYKLK
jgi:D-alanyl-D-alanine carboxypeptidase